MEFSDEVWNVQEPNETRNPPIPGLGRMVSRVEGDADFGLANRNAQALQGILAAIARTPSKSGVLYFPPGRYYLGRQPLPLPDELGVLNPISGVDSDFVIPETVTLRFAVGATLVPVNIEFFDPSPSESMAIADVRVPSFPADPTLLLKRYSERRKVRIEIRGNVEAGIHNIFDAVMENLEVGGNWTRDPNTLVEAGIVLFTRNSIREVYPEWWGAALPGKVPDRRNPPAALVRRTTLAIQEAIHAAHTRRGPLWYLNSWSSRAPGAITSPYLPPIPITLTGEYLIDSELQVGHRWREVQGGLDAGSPSASQPHHPIHDRAFILRGTRAPSRSGSGGSTIRAHRTYDETRDLASGHYEGRPARGNDPPRLGLTTPRLPPQSGSLVAARQVGGFLIENVSFDAAYEASRCVTIEAPFSAQQLIGLQGCAFRQALRELVHLGGELPVPGMLDYTEDPLTGIRRFVPPGTSLHWTSGQDILGIRMERCTFDTGDAASWSRALMSRVGLQLPGTATEVFFRARPLLGLMCRAANAIFVEVLNCAFTGPASPMILCAAGGATFNHCYFTTSFGARALEEPPDPAPAPENTLEGVDVFMDFDIVTYDPSTMRDIGIFPPVCRMKNVVSRSPRLLATFRTPIINASSIHAVELISVEHLPTLGPGDPLLPAILWAGSAFSTSRIVLIGCRFVRPSTVGRPRFPEPILIDLWPWIDRDPNTMNATETLQALTNAWDGGGGRGALPSSRGHIVDLGVKVEGMANTPLVAMSAGMWNRLRAPGRGDILSAVSNFQIIERYSVIPRP